LDAQLFANLLSLPVETRYGALEMTPALIKQRTLEAIVRRLLQLSDPNPVLFLLEDAHWIDPTSLELVQLMVSGIPEASVLLVITFRPEWSPPFSGYDHVTSLQLNRLGRSQGAEMVKAIAGSHVPQSVIERIVARTDGIPLFVEELTKSLIEGGLDIAEANIPATLQASLSARLDRLPPGAKEIAQLGAAIGREFQHELLTSVASNANTELSTVLNELIQSELVFRTGTPPEAVYTFKHALVQDAAYGSLLRGQRQKHHHEIAESLAENFPEITETEPELLAHHYTEAGLHQPAIDFWRKAGERALRRSANVEAINHLEKALALLASLPETQERDARELSVQLALGPALMAAKGQGNTEARDAYLRARELGSTLKDTPQHFRALWGSWRSHMMQGEHASARELGAECLNVAKESKDDALFLGGLFAFAGSLTLMGDYVSARDHLEQVIVPDNIEKHRAIAFNFGQDPAASMLAYKSWVLWNLGFSERAREQAQEAVALAEAVAHPLTLCQVLNYAAMTDCFCQDWAQARSRAETNLKLSEERGFPQTYWLAVGFRCRALVAEGAGEDIVSEFEAAVRERQSLGLKAGVLFEHAFLAEALSAVNRLEDARSLLDGTIRFADESGEGLHLPELYRLEGLMLLKEAKPGSVNTAEERFRCAIRIAEGQGSLSLQLRAATSLADLLANHDRTAEAHKLLTPIYARFTEGFEMSDLQAAKKMLNFLG
jgi:tetratricopeptide (TPR) repeat protein